MSSQATPRKGDPRVAGLKTRLAAYEKAAAVWKGRYARTRRVVRKLEQTQQKLREARRLLPSPAVLETLLPARLAAARIRASRPDAVARHQALLSTVERYALAVAAHEAGRTRDAERIQIGALFLWVPLDARLPERVERARRQGLPLRVILNTREVAPGRVMLDIGANLGRTAIPRVVLGDAEIAYAAEPHPDNYDCLVWSVLENGLAGLVLPDQAAIGSRDGRATLLTSRFAGGHAVREGDVVPGDEATVTVPCYRLDTWAERLGVDLHDVSFIKVDVQGWEPHVLRGAPRVLSHPHIAWQFEIAPGRLERGGSRPEELYALLDSHFDWFVDLDKSRAGSRLTPIWDLRSSVSHLERGARETDLVLWRSSGSAPARP